MLKNIIFISVVTALLFGCTSMFISGYNEPKDGHGAAVVVKNESSFDIVQLIGYKNAHDCSGGMYEMLKGERVNAGLTADTMVTAGEPLAFYLVAHRREGGILSYCSLTAEFVPELRHRYELSLSEPNSYCTIQIHKYIPGKKKPVAEPTLRFKKKMKGATWNTDPHCYPVENKRGR